MKHKYNGYWYLPEYVENQSRLLRDQLGELEKERENIEPQIMYRRKYALVLHHMSALHHSMITNFSDTLEEINKYKEGFINE